MNNPTPLLACQQLGKTYPSGGGVQTVLNQAELTLSHGEVISIIGSSGSGKTTLLHLLGALDTPDSGSIHYNGRDISELSDNERTRWRNQSLAFIFQFHLLLPEFSALENVAMPLLLRRQPPAQAFASAAECLAAVKLSEHQHKTPDQLSGGERQRTAVARALAGSPALVLADEPTGNLDRNNANTVFNLLLDNCRRRNMALILVSHDETIARQTDRILTLRDGRLLST